MTDKKEPLTGGKPGHTGLKRIFLATGNSMKGLKAGLIHESAVRQETAFLLIAAIIACVLDVSNLERAMLIGVWFIVLIVELLNSAIEAVVDRIGLDYHELSGRAKDLGSAAVFVALCLAVVSWFLILI